MCESVKALLAVQVTLLMLFGCAARPPAPAPHNVVTTAAGSASANSPTDNANLTVNQTLVQRGYQPRQLNGQLKYCRSQILTGTHFSNTVCLTQEEISATDGNTRSELDTIGRAGRAICPNNKCD
jgi:TolA-binding protein